MSELNSSASATTRGRVQKRRVARLPSRRKLNYLLLGGLLLLQVLTVAGILISQQFEGREAMRVHLQQMMAGVIGEIEENANGFLGPAQNAVIITQGLFSSALLDVERDLELERFFFHQLDALPQLNGMYYGDEKGRFVYVMRAPEPEHGAFHTKFINYENGARRTVRIHRDQSFAELHRADDPDDLYDPRVRPWYVKAKRQQSLVWTEPYVFFTSRRPGVTAAAPVRDADGNLRGVVGADIEISALSHFLAGQGIGEHGSAFIVTRDGRVVAHPRDELIKPNISGERLRLARYEELADAIDGKAMRSLFEHGMIQGADAPLFRSFVHEGELYHAGFEPFSKDREWPWIIGVYAADADFVGPLRAGQRESAVLAVLIGAFIALLAFMLAQSFVAPVAELDKEASQDGLTRVLNRRRLFEVGPDIVAQALRKSQPLCSVMFDIDNFKDINDTHGHSVGDEVLRAVAKRVRSVIAETDVLARYGGDEFKLILPNADLETGLSVAERLRRAVCESPVETSAGAIAVTISAGVAALDAKHPHFDHIVRNADRALLIAKRHGRNRVHGNPEPRLYGSDTTVFH